MLEAPVRPPYGQHNLWDLFDLEVSREIPCARVATFFHYLYSSSTHGLRVEGSSMAGVPFVDITLYGPITDDANGELNAEGKAERGASSRTLTKAELDGTSKYAGFEAEACLKVTWRLFAWQVAQRFASQESKDELVARLSELGLAGGTLDRTCMTLGLRRVK